MSSDTGEVRAGIRSRAGMAALVVVAACMPVALTPAPAAAQARTAGARDARWAQIRRIFGQNGEEADGYFRVQFPRTDLKVRIGAVTLEPEFELTSYFGFAPVGRTDVLAMGEVVMRQDEVNAALREARRQGVSVTALHNHLLDEAPRILYLHVMAEGPAAIVAAKLRSVLSTTGAPLKPAEEKEAARVPDWSAIDAVLGKHEEAEGTTVEYEFPRRESHSVHGVPVKSSGLLETGSEVVFQQLGNGRVACGGELYLLPREVEPVMDALERAGLHVTALHNHMLDEAPTMYWMHWFGTGNGPALARGVANALSHMNGARRAGA
jgi:hypothetical protein